MILFNLIVMLINVSVGVSILWYLATHNIQDDFGIYLKLGFWVSAVGLRGQAYRNGFFLFVGDSLSDNEIPFWVLKDVGLWVVGISFLIINHKENRKK